jgi:molecular chaperone GrpE
MNKHLEEDHKKRKEKKPSNEHSEAKSTDEQASNSENEVEKMKTNLVEKEKEAAEAQDKYLRALAELDNYKKFAAREKADLIKFGNENIIKDIIPILDNLDRALDHAEKTPGKESFIEGFRIIQGQILSCLEKYGVTKIESVGQDFDPNIHEAIQMVESPEYESNKVVEEFQRGYLLNGRLLKPAKVSVSKRSENNEI